MSGNNTPESFSFERLLGSWMAEVGRPGYTGASWSRHKRLDDMVCFLQLLKNQGLTEQSLNASQLRKFKESFLGRTKGGKKVEWLEDIENDYLVAIGTVFPIEMPKELPEIKMPEPEKFKKYDEEIEERKKLEEAEEESFTRSGKRDIDFNKYKDLIHPTTYDEEFCKLLGIDAEENDKEEESA